MASTVAVLLLLSAGLFTVTVGYGEDCESYYTSSYVYKPSISCGLWQHCCGTCENRYCCSSDYLKLTKHKQDLCNIPSSKNIGVAGGISGIVVGIVIICVVLIICCCCICKMCQKPRPVVGTHVTTVMNTQYNQQQPVMPVMQGAQYPAYQPVPTQPGYSGQPMQTGPYMGQLYTPGPPPPYHVAASPGYPSQAMYPMQPPAQPGTDHLPPETFKQPAYNPAYMQPPNTGY